MEWFKNKRIVVPFDFSDESVDAVRMALRLVEKRQDLHVLHVLVPLPAGEPGVIWDEMNEEKRKEHAHQAVLQHLSDLDIDGVHLDVRLGNPATVVADLVDEIQAGLVVIPSHGRTGVKRFLLGSVAERVVRLAKCPVLVLKKTD